MNTILLLALVHGESQADASHCIIRIDQDFLNDRDKAIDLFENAAFSQAIAHISLNALVEATFGTFSPVSENLTPEQTEQLENTGYAVISDVGHVTEIVARIQARDDAYNLARMDYVNLTLHDDSFCIAGTERHFNDPIETRLLDYSALDLMLGQAPKPRYPALSGLLSHLTQFADNTSLTFREESDPDNRYELSVQSDAPKVIAAVAKAFGCPTNEIEPNAQSFVNFDHYCGDVFFRDFADEMTPAWGEFFDETVTLGELRALAQNQVAA